VRYSAASPMSVAAVTNLALWLAWLACWIVAARSARRGASREGRASRLVHLGAALTSLACLVLSPLPCALPGRAILAGVGDALTCLGLGFAIWARVHLGQQWSGRVEVKQERRLVRSGPYAWARHPIYTGILLAIAGSALVVGELTAFLAVGIMGAAYLRKIRTEEAVLIDVFGGEYQRYQREVRALIPFLC
jgi:protein-S-isoprenylcysteine O-methyltransferase Ste14